MPSKQILTFPHQLTWVFYLPNEYCILILTTYLPQCVWIDLVLGILPTGLHINLIHDTVRNTMPFTNAEIVHQPAGEEDKEEDIGICFSRAGHVLEQTQVWDSTK